MKRLLLILAAILLIASPADAWRKGFTGSGPAPTCPYGAFDWCQTLTNAGQLGLFTAQTVYGEPFSVYAQQTNQWLAIGSPAVQGQYCILSPCSNPANLSTHPPDYNVGGVDFGNGPWTACPALLIPNSTTCSLVNAVTYTNWASITGGGCSNYSNPTGATNYIRCNLVEPYNLTAGTITVANTHYLCINGVGGAPYNTTGTNGLPTTTPGTFGGGPGSGTYYIWNGAPDLPSFQPIMVNAGQSQTTLLSTCTANGYPSAIAAYQLSNWMVPFTATGTISNGAGGSGTVLVVGQRIPFGNLPVNVYEPNRININLGVSGCGLPAGETVTSIQNQWNGTAIVAGVSIAANVGPCTLTFFQPDIVLHNTEPLGAGRLMMSAWVNITGFWFPDVYLYITLDGLITIQNNAWESGPYLCPNTNGNYLDFQSSSTRDVSTQAYVLSNYTGLSPVSSCLRNASAYHGPTLSPSLESGTFTGQTTQATVQFTGYQDNGPITPCTGSCTAGTTLHVLSIVGGQSSPNGYVGAAVYIPQGACGGTYPTGSEWVRQSYGENSQETGNGGAGKYLLSNSEVWGTAGSSSPLTCTGQYSALVPSGCTFVSNGAPCGAPIPCPATGCAYTRSTGSAYPGGGYATVPGPWVGAYVYDGPCNTGSGFYVTNTCVAQLMDYETVDTNAVGFLSGAGPTNVNCSMASASCALTTTGGTNPVCPHNSGFNGNTTGCEQPNIAADSMSFSGAQSFTSADFRWAVFLGGGITIMHNFSVSESGYGFDMVGGLYDIENNYADRSVGAEGHADGLGYLEAGLNWGAGYTTSNIVCPSSTGGTAAPTPTAYCPWQIFSPGTVGTPAAGANFNLEYGITEYNTVFMNNTTIATQVWGKYSGTYNAGGLTGAATSEFASNTAAFQYGFTDTKQVYSTSHNWLIVNKSTNSWDGNQDFIGGNLITLNTHLPTPLGYVGVITNMEAQDDFLDPSGSLENLAGCVEVETPGYIAPHGASGGVQLGFGNTPLAGSQNFYMPLSSSPIGVVNLLNGNSQQVLTNTCP